MQRSLFDMTVPELKAKAKRAGIRVTKKNGTPKKKAELVKEISRQTGKSDTRQDKMRKAKPPGKRKSASGRTYYEYRKNRSDVPPGLTENFFGFSNYWTWKVKTDFFDSIWNYDDYSTDDLAKMLEDEFISYILNACSNDDLLCELLLHVNELVNYREIADHYIEM